MSQHFDNTVRLSSLLVDPASLVVPYERYPRSLPFFFEPSMMPLVPQEPAGAQEPLVQMDPRRISIVAAYHHAGLEDATRCAHLRQGAAARVYTAASTLPDGFGLAVLDAWRPLSLQQRLHESALRNATDPRYVSEPSRDPATPPPHLTGGAVDVTLTWNGAPLRLGTAFDDFSVEAHSASHETKSGLVRELRRLLYWAMRDQGFVVLDSEWWHFEFGTRRWAALNNCDPLYGPASLPTRLYAASFSGDEQVVSQQEADVVHICP
jgi:D-alanyl-D-alanine dipeptidase